jgi:hypothetical protein
VTDKGDDTILATWKALLEQTPNAAVAQGLVEKLGLVKLTGRATARRPEAIQGVANGGPTDYFRRMLAEQIAPGDVRDQEVLGDIQHWNEDRSGLMLEKLFNATDREDRYLRVWEYFGTRVETEELYDIAERLFRETLRADGSGANMRDRAGLLAVWRRLNRRPDRAQAIAWLTAQIALALPISLRFADDLVYYWSGENGVVPRDGRAAVRRAMLDQARHVYETAEDLSRAMTDADNERQGYALLHFVCPPETPKQVDIEPRDREWLAPLLISVGQKRQRFVIRNLILMVGDVDVRVTLAERDPGTLLERIYRLRPERVEQIFGDTKEQLLELIASHEPGDDMEKSAAIQAAHLLSEIRGRPTPSA